MDILELLQGRDNLNSTTTVANHSNPFVRVVVAKLCENLEAV